MNVSGLSAAELRRLAAQKQKEEENTIVKTGHLKADIYYFEGSRSSVPEYCSFEQREKAIKNFTSSFRVICPAGMLFNCYVVAGEELWDSENNEICEYDEVWALDNLSNIKEANV